MRRGSALVSECASIAIVIARRATVVISDNSSQIARPGHVETAPEQSGELFVAGKVRARRADRAAVSRASDNIRAASVMRERSSASVILRGSTRTCS